MKIELEYLDLIEKLVKNSPKYSGNEDLLDDFCSESYRKSYLILQSIEDEIALESYMKKVVSSAVIEVLKENGRLVHSTKDYLNVKEIPTNYTNVENEDEPIQVYEFDSDNNENSVNLVSFGEKEENNKVNVIAERLNDNLENIKDPREGIEEQIIRKDIIENILDMVSKINTEQPQEMYLKIFYLRYFQQKKQREIAQEIDISQSEVSKRLVKLSSLIKEKLY